MCEYLVQLAEDVREWGKSHAHKAVTCISQSRYPLQIIYSRFLSLDILFVLSRYIVKMFTALKELDDS